MICRTCTKHCVLSSAETGFCKVRERAGMRDVPVSYGQICRTNHMPVSSIPFVQFASGKEMITVSPGWGCTMACQDCQSRDIAEGTCRQRTLMPEILCDMALQLSRGTTCGICFMGAEPLLHWEYVADTARMAAELGLKVALVTQGMAGQDVIAQVMPLMDAVQVQLHSFFAPHYEGAKGSLFAVKNFILHVYGNVHLELNALCYAHSNDTIRDMRRLAGWIASIDPTIPLILTRCVPPRGRVTPRYLSVEHMEVLRSVAREYLQTVCVFYETPSRKAGQPLSMYREESTYRSLHRN